MGRWADMDEGQEYFGISQFIVILSLARISTRERVSFLFYGKSENFHSATYDAHDPLIVSFPFIISPVLHFPAIMATSSLPPPTPVQPFLIAVRDPFTPKSYNRFVILCSPQPRNGVY
jgi:hypothetical protein